MARGVFAGADKPTQKLNSALRDSRLRRSDGTSGNSGTRFGELTASTVSLSLPSADAAAASGMK